MTYHVDGDSLLFNGKGDPVRVVTATQSSKTFPQLVRAIRQKRDRIKPSLNPVWWQLVHRTRHYPPAQC